MKPIITKRQQKSGVFYRIIVKYVNEYGDQAQKEFRYKPGSGVSEAKAEVLAEMYGEECEKKLLEEVSLRKKDLETKDSIEYITFEELTKIWLDYKYDTSNPNDSDNISLSYYKRCIRMLEFYNKEFGNVRVKDLTSEKIYKVYKKIESEKRVIVNVRAKDNFKDVLKERGFSYRVLRYDCKLNSCSLSHALRGMNISEKYAKELCQKTAIPFNDIFEKVVVETELSSASIYGKKKVLRAVLEFAKNVLKIITVDPATGGLISYKHESLKKESLSEEQAKKLYEASKDFDIMKQTALHLALLTGMRPAEMGGLEWRDISFSHKTISIERNAINYGKLGTIIKGTKTNRSRVIAIPDILVEQLIKYKTWQDEWKNSLGDYYKDDGQVFSTPEGNRIASDRFNIWFKKIRDAAGLPKEFTLYSLRHTNISILVGYVPISTVAQRAGHTSTKTTEEYYIHRVSEADVIASEKLNSVFEESYQAQELDDKQLAVKEYREAINRMKLLGFSRLEDYFEYVKYMKSKGLNA